MTRVANEHGAINLSQGFPDFDPPEALLAAAEKVARQGPHQYAVTWGAPNFRASLAKKQSRFMGLSIDPEAHIVVTCGSTEAMMAAMMTACNRETKSSFFLRFTKTMLPMPILSGANPIYVPLRPPDFNLIRANCAKPLSKDPKP